MLRKPVHKIENEIKCTYSKKCKDYMTKKCNHCSRNEKILVSYYNETLNHFNQTIFIDLAILLISSIGFVFLITL